MPVEKPLMGKESPKKGLPSGGDLAGLNDPYLDFHPPALTDDLEPPDLELILIEQSFINTDETTQLETALTALADDELDIVAMYFREMDSTPLLNKEEEIAYARSFRKGEAARKKLRQIEEDQKGVDPAEKQQLDLDIEEGDRAFEILVRSNCRLVVSVAKRYRGRGLEFLDLIQEGNIGLMKGVQKFDPDRDFKVSTYVSWWILKTITLAIAFQSRTIRLPVNQRSKLRHLQIVEEGLQQALGRDPTGPELAEALQITRRNLMALLLYQRQEPSSLNMPARDDDEAEVGDFIADDSPPPDELAVQTMLEADIGTLLALLSEKERRVLGLRFGLEDGDTYTLEEVGNILGLKREKVRQIEVRALRKLRRHAQQIRLKEYL